MRNLLTAALFGIVALPSLGCESGVPTGPGTVVITETTTSTTTSTIPLSMTSRFTFSPTAPHVLQDVSFDGSGSTPGTGRRIVSYDWNFGDGSTYSGSRAIKYYDAPGVYLVSLVIRDDVGGSASTSQPVTVRLP
jgi:large repetitive protein